MAASETRSSARVSPRSVTRVAAISATTSCQLHRLRAHGAGAAHVAHRAEANRFAEGLLPRHQLHEVGYRVEHPVAREDLPGVGEVDRGQLDPLQGHVLPHVQLGPVGERKDADALAGLDEAVVQVPQLGPLALGVPLAEVVAERENALLGPGALLVAAGAAEGRLEAVLLEGVEQGDRLEPVARRAGAVLLDHPAGVDRLLHGGHDQARVELLDHPVAVLHDLGEVVARVHVHHGERQAGGMEGLAGEMKQDGGVLAAREQQHGALELRRDLADHVYGLGLEGPQVGDLVAHLFAAQHTRGHGGGYACSPHSLLACPAQRPSRPFPGWVQGAQPMESYPPSCKGW